jgi:hypothetical protein
MFHHIRMLLNKFNQILIVKIILTKIYIRNNNKLTLIIINNNNNKILIIHIINKILQYRMLAPSIHKIQIYHTNISMKLMNNIIKIMMNNLIISGIMTFMTMAHMVYNKIFNKQNQ